jgi:methylglutaconyl-CoA hydratase
VISELTGHATVLCETHDGVARLTLNRPEKRNALNEELITSLKQSLHHLDRDDSVRAVILTGAGSDFCAGADLAALQKVSTASVDENLEDARSLMELFMLIRQVRMPVVAAVRGRALAGGCGLALACDIVLAERSARFGFPEVKIGFVPAMVAAILRRNVSEKKAFELLTLGEEIDAAEAEKFSLINRVFDEEGFDSSVAHIARRFTKLSQSAVGLSKRLLYQMDGLAFADALSTGADMNTIARMTADCKKGIERFLKKREDRI